MCVSPIPVPVHGHYKDGYILAPCGKCVECLSAYQNSWKIRMVEECKEWSCVAFLTLTYRDTFYPDTFLPKKYKFNQDEIRLPSALSEERLSRHVENGYISGCVPYSVVIDEETGEERRFLSCSTKHVQNWLKRCRKWYKSKYGSDAEFKYFYCTEYGPVTLRPHAHVLIFFNSEDVDFIRYMCDDWYLYHGHVDLSFPKGINDDYRSLSYSGSVEEKSEKVANYVSKYCAKGVLFENPRVDAKLVAPCVRRSSKFLGAAYVGKHIREVLCLDWFAEHHLDENSSYYGRFNPAYLDAIHSQMKWHSCSNEFTYKMPRYYGIKFLRRDIRTKLVRTGVDSGRFLESETGYNRYSQKSPLEVAYSAYLLSLSDSDALRQFSKLRSENPTWSDSKIYSFLANREVRSRQIRKYNREKSLTEFYMKSKL